MGVLATAARIGTLTDTLIGAEAPGGVNEVVHVRLNEVCVGAAEQTVATVVPSADGVNVREGLRKLLSEPLTVCFLRGVTWDGDRPAFAPCRGTLAETRDVSAALHVCFVDDTQSVLVGLLAN